MYLICKLHAGKVQTGKVQQAKYTQAKYYRQSTGVHSLSRQSTLRAKYSGQYIGWQSTSWQCMGWQNTTGKQLACILSAGKVHGVQSTSRQHIGWQSTSWQCMGWQTSTCASWLACNIPTTSFVHSKCERSSLRSQCCMILFLWFSNPVPDTYWFKISFLIQIVESWLFWLKISFR